MATIDQAPSATGSASQSPPTHKPHTNTHNWTVIKLTNIPWDLRSRDVINRLALLPGRRGSISSTSPSSPPASTPATQGPDEHVDLATGHTAPYYTEAIHIPCDFATGKTKAACYIEVPSMHQATRMLRTLYGGQDTSFPASSPPPSRSTASGWTSSFSPPRTSSTVAPSLSSSSSTTPHRGTLLKGRMVYATMASQQELMHAIFPRLPAAGTGLATRSDMPSLAPSWYTSRSSASDVPPSYIPETSSDPYPYINRDEATQLLLVCRNFKMHYSRKCAERPFENIISSRLSHSV
ncbi:hypothetical protein CAUPRSCDRAFT_10386 [Caulochytrium protostelioides]|uniref:Uncharacterized protein n=1 Tax=Caulochytrium protostelioides TaxID=1555241 RepID=A0A4P9WZX4_9FUNG|nr:hypothetical protein CAUPRSCDRAFT_10386 [Caulochytrium protostelioides]